MTSISAVIRSTTIAPRERGEGVRTFPMVNAQIGSTKTLSGVTEFDPNAAVALHTHNCEETVMVLEGEAVVEIDGVEHALTVTDCTWIPAGAQHRFRNASATRQMKIYWTYASIDATRTVIATGVTTRIDEEHGVAVAK